jgi:5-formyltetrahydrofolate cyclo-ligase
LCTAALLDCVGSAGLKAAITLSLLVNLHRAVHQQPLLPVHDVPCAACFACAQVDEPLDLIVMPGLAFDCAGRRLGRGGGYYDKFLHAVNERAAARGWAPPLLLALSYRAQLVENVPVEPHDVSVDAIVTPDGVVACTPAGAAALPPPPLS